MSRKLTITVSEAVHDELNAAYRDMAADLGREREANAWAEGVVGDACGDSQRAAR